MGKLRLFFGLGPSKAEQIEELENRLMQEARHLDFMAYRHPKTYREMCEAFGEGWRYRPGVAYLEMQAAIGDSALNRPNAIRDQFERECG